MSDRRYVINLTAISFKAWEEIYKLDKEFVGTPEYMGLAYYWSTVYKYYLRDCSIAQRRRIHRMMLKADLVLHETSDEHLDIIRKVLDGKLDKSGGFRQTFEIAKSMEELMDDKVVSLV